jgi:ABC-type transport system substrate-binding protein
MYPTLDDGYAGYVAGEHDLMDNLPAERYAEARSLYSDRIFEQASNSYTYLGIPVYRTEFQDKRVRQAISLAIDRKAIIDEIYNGQYLAASTILSPNFPGFREHPGDFCTFDPARARQLLDEAGGWQGGVLALHTNVGGGHAPWLTLVGAHLREHLGIECEVDESKPFADYFQQAKDAAYTGLFRRAWAPDYAWPESYLGPILQRGGSANQQFYDNPDYDALLAKADQASDLEEGIALYQRAEDLALEELPIIPLWFQKTSVLYGERVTRYVRNIINGSDYAQIDVNPTA